MARPASPMPPEVAGELRRLVRRWQQLPLDHASSCMPQVRRLLATLADRDVPDLGPGVVMDQLTVLVYDACAAGRTAGLGRDLATLRAQLP